MYLITNLNQEVPTITLKTKFAVSIYIWITMLFKYSTNPVHSKSESNLWHGNFLFADL